MKSISVGPKQLLLPSIVPSVSSFETQANEEVALALQKVLNEPISLVSAYDLRPHTKQNGKQSGTVLLDLCQEYKKQGILMLDSGGYEASRVAKYLNISPQKHFGFDAFKTVCQNLKPELCFSYDYFIGNEDENETASDFGIRLSQSIIDHFEFLDKSAVMPVLHLISRDGSRHLQDHELTEVLSRLISECSPRVIGIPEREMGAGLRSRFAKTKIITSFLAERGHETKLHVLGCGNLLSCAVLAFAGASLFDGLEWCRVFADDSFHLHHFQHAEFYGSKSFQSPSVEKLISGAGMNYIMLALTKNLNSLQLFSNELRESINNSTQASFVGAHFGQTAETVVQELLS